MLRLEELQKLNYSSIENNIRTERYKTYAHNLKYFKDFAEVQSNLNSSRS